MRPEGISPAAGVGARRRLLPALTAVAAALGLAACGSSTAAAPSAAEISSTCQAIAAVLSNGPDPTADPVGYAQAQILPLRQISTTDGQLKLEIKALDSAYSEFYYQNGAKSAAAEVASASKAIDRSCPGVTS